MLTRPSLLVPLTPARTNYARRCGWRTRPPAGAGRPEGTGWAGRWYRRLAGAFLCVGRSVHRRYRDRGCPYPAPYGLTHPVVFARKALRPPGGGRSHVVGRTPAPAPFLALKLRAALPAPRRRTSRAQHPAPLV